MMRQIVGVVTLAVLLSSTVSLGAHDIFRIIGTIVKFEKLELDVKTAEGETFAIKLQESTLIQRAKKRIPATELKTGRSVLVDVMGDTKYDDDLFVIGVTLVPAIAPPRRK